MVPAFPDRWRVSGHELIAETYSSRIWKVGLANGEAAIVKDLKPFDDVEDELRGARCLSWREGVGAVKLLDLDGHRMLLEHAGERMLSEDLAECGDAFATEIAAEVMGMLFSPSDTPVPEDAPPEPPEAPRPRHRLRLPLRRLARRGPEREGRNP